MSTDIENLRAWLARSNRQFTIEPILEDVKRELLEYEIIGLTMSDTLYDTKFKGGGSSRGFTNFGLALANAKTFLDSVKRELLNKEPEKSAVFGFRLGVAFVALDDAVQNLAKSDQRFRKKHLTKWIIYLKAYVSLREQYGSKIPPKKITNSMIISELVNHGALSVKAEVVLNGKTRVEGRTQFPNEDPIKLESCKNYLTEKNPDRRAELEKAYKRLKKNGLTGEFLQIGGALGPPP